MTHSTLTAKIIKYNEEDDYENYCGLCEAFNEVIHFRLDDTYGRTVNDWYFCITCLDIMHSNIRNYPKELEKGETITSAIFGL